MNIDNRIVVKNSQFQLEEIDTEQLLYNPLLTKTIYLNATATLIWSLCNGENTVGHIISLLTQTFEQSEQVIRTDVIDAIDELLKNQALFLK